MSGRFFTFALAGRRARAAAVTCCAAALALAAGCSAGITSGTAAKPPSPRTELILAADQAERVTSMAASFSSQTSGNAAENFTGTMQAQLKPTLEVEVTGSAVVSDGTLNLTEILTDKALYIKMPQLSKLAGKPWVKVPFSGLSGSQGALFSQLVQGVQNDSPSQQITMMSTSKNVRAAGTQVIDGVRTTAYTGSFTAAAALAALSPSERQTLGPELKQVQGQAHFTEWIDAQHHVRRSTMTETVNGAQVTLAFTITAFNQPVHIVLPRPRRVALVPGGSL